MYNNAFFKRDDPQIGELCGVTFPAGWWSRFYEYPWALSWAVKGGLVADMGAGSHYRPFRDEIAKTARLVYAVDKNWHMTEQEKPDNVQFVVADFTQPVTDIEGGSLDRIFCISVLEECGDLIPDALREFRRLIKQDGRIIITCDTQADMDKPFPVVYPGINLDGLPEQVHKAGLYFDGAIDYRRANILVHEEWNLAVWHMVLKCN